MRKRFQKVLADNLPQFFPGIKEFQTLHDPVDSVDLIGDMMRCCVGSQEFADMPPLKRSELFYFYQNLAGLLPLVHKLPVDFIMSDHIRVSRKKSK